MSQTATKERSRLDEFANMQTGEITSGEAHLPAVIEPAALGVLNRSEIDAQIALAAGHPRNLKAFRQGVRDLAMLNTETADECTYVIPRDGKDIPGPSIRFAEIVAYNFTHYRTGARIIEEAFDHVTAQGYFIDLQNNGVTTFELSRRITGRNGRRYSADMINTTKNAACQLAKRNAILQAVPRPLWHDIWEETRRFAAGGNQQSIVEKIDRAVEAFIKAGASEERIYAALGVKRRGEIGLDELQRLRGFWTALNDGEMTIDEIFPAAKVERPAGLDQFASAKPEADPAASSAASPEGSAGANSEPPLDTAAQAPADPDQQLRLYRMCIDKVLQAALDKKTLPDVEDRVANLDGPIKEIWMSQPIEPAFVLKALKQGIDVARGDTKPETARKMLEGLVP